MMRALAPSERLIPACSNPTRHASSKVMSDSLSKVTAMSLTFQMNGFVGMLRARSPFREGDYVLALKSKQVSEPARPPWLLDVQLDWNPVLLLPDPGSS